MLAAIFIPLIFVSSAYTPMEPLPGIKKDTAVNLTDYLSALFKYAITVAAVLAVIMIVIGGMQYIGASGNTSVVEDAKDRIYWAIVGLILALGSWLILNTINPNLKNLELKGIEKQSIKDITTTELFSEINGNISTVEKKSAEYQWKSAPYGKDCADIIPGCVGVDSKKCGETKPAEKNICCACPN